MFCTEAKEYPTRRTKPFLSSLQTVIITSHVLHFVLHMYCILMFCPVPAKEYPTRRTDPFLTLICTRTISHFYSTCIINVLHSTCKRISNQKNETLSVVSTDSNHIKLAFCICMIYVSLTGFESFDPNCGNLALLA